MEREVAAPISSQLAVLILAFAAIWLVWIGVVMIANPRRALSLLRQTASSYQANIAEQIPRLVAGVALILRAQESKFPTAFEVGGWFIIVTSVALLSIPLRWHAGYARWWADRMPDIAVRAVGPISIAAGGALAYATI